MSASWIRVVESEGITKAWLDKSLLYPPPLPSRAIVFSPICFTITEAVNDEGDYVNWHPIHTYQLFESALIFSFHYGLLDEKIECRYLGLSLK